jgi:F0F1-type ATP synthase delta subunit
MAESNNKAQPGDLILVTNAMFPSGKYVNGDILTVISSDDASATTDKGRLFDEEFKVVSSDKLIGIVANLIRRVSSLEDQLRMTQGNFETLAQENATISAKVNETRELTDMALDDIVFLDERTMAHNISVNLRIDREADVTAIAEVLTKLTKGGDV